MHERPFMKKGKKIPKKDQIKNRIMKNGEDMKDYCNTTVCWICLFNFYDAMKIFTKAYSSATMQNIPLQKLFSIGALLHKKDTT